MAENKTGLFDVRTENLKRIGNVQNEEYVYDGETDENGAANGSGEVKLNVAVIQGNFAGGHIDGDYIKPR